MYQPVESFVSFQAPAGNVDPLGDDPVASARNEALVEFATDTRLDGIDELRSIGAKEASVSPLAQLENALADADIAVFCVNAPNGEPLLREPTTRALVRRRSYRPLMLLDLGVPRNVDPTAGRLDGIFLHDVDHLGQLVEQIAARRSAEVPKVEAIVQQELARYRNWLVAQGAAPLVCELRRSVDGSSTASRAENAASS